MKTAAEIGLGTLARLARQAERNKAVGNALSAEIRAAMGAYPDPERMTAKNVRNSLSRAPLPSIRTIQEHMRAIRAESAESRLECGAGNEDEQIAMC